eukprot:3941931-Rhodomonas_salina.4
MPSLVLSYAAVLSTCYALSGTGYYEIAVSGTDVVCSVLSLPGRALPAVEHLLLKLCQMARIAQPLRRCPSPALSGQALVRAAVLSCYKRPSPMQCIDHMAKAPLRAFSPAYLRAHAIMSGTEMAVYAPTAWCTVSSTAIRGRALCDIRYLHDAMRVPSAGRSPALEERAQIRLDCNHIENAQQDLVSRKSCEIKANSRTNCTERWFQAFDLAEDVR